MTWFVSTSDIFGLIVFSLIIPPIAALWVTAVVNEKLGNRWPAAALAFFAAVVLALWAAEAAALYWWFA